jgi:hypothetical protein
MFDFFVCGSAVSNAVPLCHPVKNPAGNVALTMPASSDTLR